MEADEASWDVSPRPANDLATTDDNSASDGSGEPSLFETVIPSNTVATSSPVLSQRSSMPALFTQGPIGGGGAPANSTMRHYKEIAFCQSEEGLHEHADISNHTLILENGKRPLRAFQISLGNIKGCTHPPEDAKRCVLCINSMAEWNPFLVNDKTLDAERQKIAAFIIDNRSLAIDALTWLTMRIDWEIKLIMQFYFSQNYPVLEETMSAINQLPERDLDGRAAAQWREANLSRKDPARPSYCSWVYVPRTKSEQYLNIFYVPTRSIPESFIVDYLTVLLRPPQALSELLAEAQSKALESPRFMADMRLKRRKSLYKQRPTPTDVVGAMAGEDTEDPREQRAVRLDNAHQLRTSIEATLPQLIFLATDKRIKTLQPRPDYILEQHTHYINVFTIKLHPDAPLVWPGPVETRFESIL